jgi:adenylyltransferase/sulfurtransferase
VGTLTDDERRRYARNLSLPEVGEEGQQKIMQASVLVVGAGGLGSAVIAYLAAAGIGHIGIADYDRVELSNLQRQVIYESGDIGRLKTESARDRVQELNPEVRITLHSEKLDSANSAGVVKGYDIVADGSDNFATRFAVNAACFKEKKPLVSAALRAWQGQLGVFKPYLNDSQPCYACLVSAAPDDDRGCRDAGVMGAFAGVMGSLQALEIIKEILGMGTLAGKLLIMNGLTLVTKTSHITRDLQCKVCNSK